MLSVSPFLRASRLIQIRAFVFCLQSIYVFLPAIWRSSVLIITFKMLTYLSLILSCVGDVILYYSVVNVVGILPRVYI
jgi:hypothetical protein